MVRNKTVYSSQVLLISRYPMKLSLFCLGSTAAVVMVGSAGIASEGCHKADAESRIIRNRPNIALSWRELKSYRQE